MATTSDNSSPPSPTSESVQSTEVQFHDNGVLAGTAVADLNGAWRLMLNNLTEGSHIMTASSGGTVSNEWVVNVQARSGSEDWTDFPATTLDTDYFYFGKSGLIACLLWAEGSEVRATITTMNQTLVLLIAGGFRSFTVGFILPVTANRITITIAREVSIDQLATRVSFFTDNGISITAIPTGKVGDQTFAFDKPIRYIRWKHQSMSNPFNISKIAWSNA